MMNNKQYDQNKTLNNLQCKIPVDFILIYSFDDMRQSRGAL